MKLLALLLALIPFAAFACEDLPSVQSLMEKADIGKKGYLTKDEYKDQELFFPFAEIDRNKDHKLTPDELGNACSDYHKICDAQMNVKYE